MRCTLATGVTKQYSWSQHGKIAYYFEMHLQRAVLHVAHSTGSSKIVDLPKIGATLQSTSTSNVPNNFE
ncbi:hypothetical protein e1116g03.tmp0231 [Eimeria tenella]|uniref:Uncharacterized protein n=1 Tax=Eimeria tenella TaxID=5802 RepID=C8TE56_EIMTE|nr:hypothetical protein e1116g03.tmp0231 [Eimeria tenella]